MPRKKKMMADQQPKASFKKIFKTLIWPRKRLLFLGLFLIVVNRMAGLILPGSSKFLVDEVIANEDYGMLRLLLIVVTAALIVQSVSSFFLTQLLSVEAQQLIAKLRSQIQEHVMYLPTRFFDSEKSGTLVARIMNDVEGVRNLVGTGLVQLIGGVLTAIVSLIILLNINAVLTAYVLGPLIIFGIVSLFAFKKIRPIFRNRQVINSEVTGRLTETLNGVRVIKGFNAEQQEVKTFADGVDRLFRNIRKSLIATSIVTSSSTLLLGLASVGIMGIGGYMIMGGTLTVGDFLAFILYLGFMIAPIVQMSNIGTQITDAIAGLDRVEELLAQPRETDAPDRTVMLPEVKGHLQFKDVHFAYEEGQPVLKGVSFNAPPGSVTALVGSSGSGKTTIASLAASFLDPGDGEILIDGQDLTKVRHESYRQHLGVVLQDDFLFEGSIRENILFPRPGATEEELQHAVKAAHVDEFSDRFEKGLETVIGERGVKLSGGQRQRLAIARAILADPRLLILDEATSNLDMESEAFIQESLHQLMKGRTTLVIAHRLSTIRNADQILVVENGQIVERGQHDELLSLQGRYYDLYNYQARI